MPVYNIQRRKNHFIKAVESVLKQSYTDIELILVNDGSNDKTEQIIKVLQQRDKRIVYINKSNGGVESARRMGLQRTTGEFVFHLDQDDMLHTDALRLLYEAIEKNDADVAIGNSVRFWGMPIIRKKNTNSNRETLLIQQKDFMDHYYRGFFGINIFPIQIWNKLYRKSFLDLSPEVPRVGGYHEDLNYNLCILPYARKLVWLAETTYFYRWGGFTSHKIEGLLDVALSCYNIKMQKIKEMGLSEFKVSTCIELLNYLQTCLYQEIEYREKNSISFNDYCKSVLNMEEVKYAIYLVKTQSTYRNAHIRYMIDGDIVGLELYEKELFRKNTIKRYVKKMFL